MPKRIIKLDASSLVKSACNLRLYNLIIMGYRHPLVSNDIAYGSAVHKFVEVMFRTGGKLDEAIKAAKVVFDRPCIVKPTKKYLTANHLIRTCLDFWQEFIEKDDFEYFMIGDAPAVEITFSILIYEDEFCQIYLEGTIDKLGKIKNGCYAVGDYKTTSVWDKESYFNQYRLSPQLKTYIFAVKHMANEDSKFAKIASTPLGAFIDGVFLSGSKPSEFARSEVIIFKPQDLDEYQEMLKALCREIAQWIRYDFTPPANGKLNGACQERFGPCAFFNICAAPDDVTRGQLFTRDFIKKPYEPLKFGEPV